MIDVNLPVTVPSYVLQHLLEVAEENYWTENGPAMEIARQALREVHYKACFG